MNNTENTRRSQRPTSIQKREALDQKLKAKKQLPETKKEESESSSDESSISSVILNTSVFDSSNLEDPPVINNRTQPAEEPSLNNVLDRAFEESVENNIVPTMAKPRIPNHA